MFASKPKLVSTDQEKIQEILKCGKDPIYFIKSYAKIRHPLKGTIPFELYPFQADAINSFQKKRFNIVLKSRQIGLSTVAAAYATWMAIFHKDKTILIIATKLATAKNFIVKVSALIKNLPPWLMLPKFEASQQCIRFDNGSKIEAIPTSEDAGRSEALSLLIIDEAAFIKNFDDIWTAIWPTISTGGRAILISTPNGVGGQYYKLWMDAEAGVNDFNPMKFPWFVHPEHDDEWFRKETRGAKPGDIAQEFMCSFIASGDTFLQASSLDWLVGMSQQPMTYHSPSNHIWVWEDPDPDQNYVISADVARGDARDYSAFHIINADTNHVAAEYMGKAPPEQLANIINEWGIKYNGALAIVENNTYGYFVNTKLKDLKYPTLYYATCNGDHWNYVSTEDEKPGFVTTSKSRVQILTKLEVMIRNKKIITRSQRLVDQFQSFVWSGAKPMAQRDSYDDLIMSLAIGCWVLSDDSTGTGTSASDMTAAMLNATSIVKRSAGSIVPDSFSLTTLNRNQQGSVPHPGLRASPIPIQRPLINRYNPDLTWLLK